MNGCTESAAAQYLSNNVKLSTTSNVIWVGNTNTKTAISSTLYPQTIWYYIETFITIMSMTIIY